MSALFLQISPECKDLIDRIFNVDSAERFGMEDMKKHPWYNKPLTPRHQAAIDRINAEQAELEKRSQTIRIDEVWPIAAQCVT